MKKTIIVIGSIVAIIYVGQLVCKTLCISCTTPPIKKYRYGRPTASFMKGLETLDSLNQQIDISAIDTIDDKSTRFGYAIILNVRHHGELLRFHLIAEKITYDDDLATLIKLSGAKNLTSNTGGYGINADGIQPLINNFKKLILDELEKQAGIKITPAND